MDRVRFEAAAYELLDSLGTRLPEQTRESVRIYVWGGEEGLAADELGGALSLHHVPVSPRERDLLHEVLYALDIDIDDEQAKYYPWLYDRDRVLASLNVVSDPPAPSPSPPPRSPDR